MSVHVIRVPDLGEGIAEVELVAWHVQPGDAIAEDQGLADVMTDKASVEIPSPVAGKVIALGGEVGQMLAVGSELIRIELEGSAGASTPAPASMTERATTVATAPKAAEPKPAAEAKPVAASKPAAAAKPAVASIAAPVPRAAAGTRPIASPAVRARAWELGVDLKTVAATGMAGRITRADLEAQAARAGARSGQATRGVAPASDATEAIKIVGLRRRIAQKMQESKRRIPHYTYVEELDVTEIEGLRAHLNAKWRDSRARLTLLPFLVRAVVLAVRDFPMVNARFDDEAGVLTRHSAVHVGIATQTPAGLVVPVLRDAQAHDLWSSAAEIARLAESARSGKAVRDELTGSTITITSLGKLGGIVSTPVINHPEVAIVGVNRVALRPAVRDGGIVPRQLMNLSSSFDHRVVDGADAAAFIQRVRELVERPATLFVE
ncbi:MAG TPA: dihydrolipoamide acetyltransferase family protein [Caldimonas sp.]|nr:dihydrolipoamide acetyltransferase family protein [Caldimonas sp.]HEX4235844.1 dihydrolipoamide acetyltransferase family protein [Caldimonas sp.]